MSILIAENSGFRGSLELARFADNFEDQNFDRDPAHFVRFNIYYDTSVAPQKSARLYGFGQGYSSAPATTDGQAGGTSYEFKANGGTAFYFGRTDAPFDQDTSLIHTLQIKDAFYTDTISVPYDDGSVPRGDEGSYHAEKGGLVGLQEAINAGPITFFGGDGGTDTVKVAGGALAFDDTLYGRGGDDYLEGGAGNDLIDGGVGNDILVGGTGNDRLFGGNETDQLFGDEGNDFLDGGLGGDRMSGGIGDDTYVVDNIYDAVLEASGQGTDTVFSSISYALPGAVENITLTGTSVINATGNGLKNTLIGNGASNTLDGGGYDDVLNGKGGADILIGGTGFDTFVFAKGEADGDVIQDFTGYGKAFGDRIVFQGYDADAVLQKGAGDVYQIVDGASVETITIKGAVDLTDYVFVA